MLTLRPYQQEAVAAFDRALAESIRRPLIVMPTGAGKTVLFLALIDLFISRNPRARALVIAHRKELVIQPESRFRQFFGDKYRTGVVSSKAKRYEYDGQVTFAGKDTIINPRHMERLIAHGPIDVVITDECHHAFAPSYRQLITCLEVTNPDLIHLGVTATPTRGDGNGLGQVFDAAPWNSNGAIYSLALRDLIPQHLVSPRWLAIKTGIKLDGVHTRAGDYVQRELTNVFETPECLDLVVKTHQEHGGNRKAIAFTTSVKGAHELATKFCAAGIPAAAIDGTMDNATRSDVLARFARREIEVICNCAILTVVFFDPRIEPNILVRPTKSDSLYLQCIGRGLRPRNGHQPEPDETCLILEYAPAATRSLAHVGFLMGVPPEEQKKLELAQDALDRIDKELANGDIQAGIGYDGKIKIGGIGIDGLAIVAMELNYLDTSPYIWHKDGAGWWSLGLGESPKDRYNRVLMMSPRRNGQHVLYGLVKPKPTAATPYPLMTVRVLARGDFEAVNSAATAAADRNANPALAAKNKDWHNRPMSESQENAIKRLANKRKLDPMTQAQASQTITHLLGIQALQRTGYYADHEVVEEPNHE